MLKFFLGFVKEEEGATATEYILLVVFVALVMAAGAFVFGDALGDFFGTTGSNLEATGPTIPDPTTANTVGAVD